MSSEVKALVQELIRDHHVDTGMKGSLGSADKRSAYNDWRWGDVHFDRALGVETILVQRRIADALERIADQLEAGITSHEPSKSHE